MSFLRNIKDWFTDLLGATIMVTASYFFFWDERLDIKTYIICLVIGFVLLWVPDELILNIIKKWAGKKINEDIPGDTDNKPES